MAATDPKDVDQMDSERAGNLGDLVAQYFKANLKVDCGAVSEAKYEAFKMQSASLNEDKIPGTPYDYEATYLVTQKCSFGSTYAGAIMSLAKSVIISANFHSKYNKQKGPAKMEELEFKLIKEIDLGLKQN